MAAKDTAKQVLKVNRKTFFNPRGWLGYDQLKAQTLFLFAYLKQLFIPAKPDRIETFEEAVARLNLSEADIKEMRETYFYYSVLFLAIAVVAFLSSFYFIIVHGSFSGWLLTMAVSALLGAQAFRYNFWYFQIKNRKLGCTYKEWIQGKTNSEEV
jgi:intracellular multiplication protein IcmV